MTSVESLKVRGHRPDVGLLDEVAGRLRRLFAGTARAYILQQPDGSYRTVRRRLTSNVVKHMLLTAGSVGAYQVSNGRVAWMCLDFDITKLALDSAGQAQKQAILHDRLLPLVDQLLQRLRALAIPHLVEFSGNRGIHVWVTFDRPVGRATAHQMLSALLDSAGLSGDLGDIHVDRFPPNAESSSRYGNAVKLPLACNQKSKHFSYLMAVPEGARLSKPESYSSLSDDLLLAQLSILEQHQPISLPALLEKLNLPEDPPGPAETPVAKFLRCKVVYPIGRPDLAQVKAALSRCALVSALFSRISESKSATEDDRVTVAGLLNRIQGPHGELYGQELLLEFFSMLPAYNEEITREKLGRLRLPPPTCAHLQRRHPGIPCECTSNNSFPASPILHLSSIGILIDPLPVFELLDWEADNLRAAQVRYSLDNDEIPICSTITELESLTSAELADWTCVDEDPPRSMVRFHRFEREQEDASTRKLFALSAKDKLWTSAHTLCLNHVYHGEFSDRSFGYRLQPGCGGHNLFLPWFRQWQAFVAEISDYVDDSAYDDYIVLKLDIKSYYDSVDLHRLQAVLFDGATAGLRQTLAQLSPQDASLHRAAVRHLVTAARQMVGGDRGLPQGPAFARYLAELFLLELDSLCEGFFDQGTVHHSRFVDDIVLIFEPEYAAASGTAMNRIGDYLRTLGLDLNPAKAFHGKVSEFRAIFKAYRQEDKYIIDQASRRYRAAPKATIDAAAKRLLNVIGIDGTTTPKTDQLSFFYSHLTESPGIAALQRKLEGVLLMDTVGRGAIFARAFEHRINRLIADASETLPDALSSLTGLRREAFLNAVLAAGVRPKLTENAVVQLRPILNAFASSSASALERHLLLLIMLVDSRLADPSFLEAAAMNDCASAVSANLDKSIPQSWSDRMLDELEKAPFSDHVLLAYSLLFESQCDPSLESKICRLFIDRSLTAIGTNTRQYRHDMFKCRAGSAETTELLEKYQQLVCLAPLADVTSSRNAEQLSTLWANAVASWQSLNQRPRWHPLWLRRAAKKKELANVNPLIIGGIRQSMLDGQPDHERIFKSYYEVLILCILGTSSNVPDNWDQQNLQEALASASNKSRFLQWILDNGSETIPWPNTDECVENVVRNDLMALYRNDELMVRLPSSWTVPDFEHLTDLRRESDGIGTAYQCLFYSLSKGDFKEVQKEILEPETDLIEFSRQALEVRERI